MPKGDSSKRKKTDKDGSSNKKQKGDKNQQQQQVQQQQRQGSITTASTEITMTIPRKKDNKNKAAAAAANNESSSFSLPKIPKKSDKQQQQQQSKSLSPPVDIMMGTIPKKKSDKRSSVGSLDSMTIPKKSNKSSNNSNNKSEKHAIKADNKSTSITASNDTSNKTTTSEKATVSINKKEGPNSGVDSSSSKKDKEKITTSVTATPSTKDSRTNETVTASKITPKKSSGNKAGKTGQQQQQQQQQQPQKPRGRGRPPSALKLKIDTSIVGGSTTGDHSSSTKGGGSSKPPMTPSSGTAMDSHPFARGSVIEVLHGVFKDPSGDSWWSDDSDEEEAKKEEEEKNKSKQSVRLCDIIDRVATDADKNHWRYYVHYRDFNRRMDEWIPMERIVSPPSVGNAKARALKKEEERQKRKQQRLEEKKAELQSGVNVSGPRASRRRSTVVNNQQQPGGGGSGGGGGGAATGGGADPSAVTAGGANTPTGADGETDTPRRTRLRRRSVDDDGTVVASNQSGGGGGGDKSSSRGGDVGVGGGSDGSGPPPQVVMAAEKGVVAIQTQAATHTTVGEHVVATIPAQELDEHEGLDEASLREHEEVTKVKNVEFLELGAYQMETWYFSPLPKELLNEKGLIDVLYVCEFTFNMFSRKNELRRFQSRLKPHMRHPPGNEIYRNGNIAMFEVDGFEQRIYCQNLCYIAKLFLDHKTLYFDVDPFLFYVLCEVDKRGFHPVGYYSKEKYSDVGYGYGRFLIAFSYELSKKEEKVGSPEKPMSDLGQQAYKPYWASTIVDFLLNQSPDSSSMSIMDISKQTSIMAEDIVFTLNQLGILKIINGVYFIAAEVGLLRTLGKKYPVKKPIVDPSKLHWTPFITDIKRDKFSIHSKKASVDSSETRGDKNDATTK